jgi:hypothetical protein
MYICQGWATGCKHIVSSVRTCVWVVVEPRVLAFEDVGWQMEDVWDKRPSIGWTQGSPAEAPPVEPKKGGTRGDVSEGVHCYPRVDCDGAPVQGRSCGWSPESNRMHSGTIPVSNIRRLVILCGDDFCILALEWPLHSTPQNRCMEFTCSAHARRFCQWVHGSGSRQFAIQFMAPHSTAPHAPVSTGGQIPNE